MIYFLPGIGGGKGGKVFPVAFSYASLNFSISIFIGRGTFEKSGIPFGSLGKLSIACLICIAIGSNGGGMSVGISAFYVINMNICERYIVTKNSLTTNANATSTKVTDKRTFIMIAL